MRNALERVAGNGEERHRVTPDELCPPAWLAKPLVPVNHRCRPRNRCQLFLLHHYPFARVSLFSGPFPRQPPPRNRVIILAFVDGRHLVRPATLFGNAISPTREMRWSYSFANCLSWRAYESQEPRRKLYNKARARII